MTEDRGTLVKPSTAAGVQPVAPSGRNEALKRHQVHRDVSLSVKAMVVGDTMVGRQDSDTGLPSRAARRVRDSGSICGTAMVAAFAAACLTGGCSPYVYKNEIQGFAAGVGTLDRSYEEGLRSIADQRVAAYNAVWQNKKTVVGLSPDCDLVSSGDPKPCGVIDPVSAGDDRTAGPGIFERTAAEQRPHIKVLADYVAGLDAVTRAEDREAFDNAAAGLAQSVDNLAGRVVPAATAPPLGPLVGLFTYVAGTYLDHRRFVALRSAVRAADPELAKLKQPFSIAFENLARAKRQYLLIEGREVEFRLGRTGGRPPSDEVYETNLKALERIGASTDALAQSDPGAVVDEMVEAHGELRRALDEARGQDKEVIKAIKGFVERAKAVQAAFAAAAAAEAAA